MGGVGQDHVAIDRPQLVGEFLEQRQEGQIRHQHAILGVVDDPDDLLGEQARIDGVIDGTDSHDAVPGFQVAPRVPGQRRHPVAELDPVALEPLRDLERPRADRRIGGGVERALRPSGSRSAVRRGWPRHGR